MFLLWTFLRRKISSHKQIRIFVHRIIITDTLNSAETANQNIIHEWHWTWALTAVIDSVFCCCWFCLIESFICLLVLLLLLVSIYPPFFQKNPLRIIIYEISRMANKTEDTNHRKKIDEMCAFLWFLLLLIFCVDSLVSIEQTKFRANENGQKQ